MENLYTKHGLVSRTYYKKSLIMASTFGSKSKSFMTMSIPSQDEPLTNRPVSTFDRRLIKLKNQVQRLMEAHLASTQPTQVKKITTSCEIYSGPHDTQYCMKDLEQAFMEYASSHTDKASEGLVSNFMASQDARLSKFEADFKQQQSEMTHKIDTVLKAITDRITGTLPSHTVKNPKLSTSPVLFAHSYPSEEPLCSTHIYGLINTITIHPKQQIDSRDSMAKEEKQEREDDSKDTNTIAYIEERREMPLLERKHKCCCEDEYDRGCRKPFRFTNRTDEVAYKMPHKIEQYNSLSDLEKEHTKLVYLRNDEDRRRGVELYLTRRTLEVLRKFHWMILGG
ncbi:hypothetical protein Tco_1402991 [Tanacetum coccineum]